MNRAAEIRSVLPRRWALAALMALLVGRATTGWAASAKLLLRVEATATSPFFNSVQDSDQLIFSDGLVIRTTQGFAYDSGESLGCQLERFTANAVSLANLKGALKASHVGLLDGDCTVNTVVDHAGVVEDVTWFGRGGRRNTYRIVKVNDPSTCGGEVAIAGAVNALGGGEFSQTTVTCPDLEASP